MRISKLKLNKSVTEPVGLKEIDLTKKPLGSTVALVGKNGAGKSRILKLVENYFGTFTSLDLTKGFLVNIPLTLSEQYNKKKADIEAQVNINHAKGLRDRKQERLKTMAQQEFLDRIKQLGQAYIKVIDNDDLKNIKANINGSKELTFESILSNSHFDNIVKTASTMPQNSQLPSGVFHNEFTTFNSQSTIQYLSKLSTEILTDRMVLLLDHEDNPELVKSEIRSKNSYKLFNIFQNYVKQFLGKEFSYKPLTSGNIINSVLWFENGPFDINQFSPGQKTLFAYAILFFYLDTNSKTNIKDSIIIVDEPEKHLHPEAQIALINALKNIVSGSGQLWIATHSVNILSHLSYDEILMVNDGEIVPPSRTTPGRSFNDLMGLEEHIIELTGFINSISEWAYGNFMVQCFKGPDVVFGNDANDPQYQLFKEFVSSKGPFSLLDYGAGKGRIGYTIHEDEQFRPIVQYSAFEPNKENFDLLDKALILGEVYQIADDIPSESFDCVLLCNVLHEINPKEWEETFMHVKRVLKPNGYLLIIEDKFLPKGENAHEFGYLILGNEQLKVLFNQHSIIAIDALELSLRDKHYDERIVFAAFKKSQIDVSNESVKASILSLQESAYNNIKTLRGKTGKDLNHGRLYANQTQLYINAQLAIEGLTSSLPNRKLLLLD